MRLPRGCRAATGVEGSGRAIRPAQAEAGDPEEGGAHEEPEEAAGPGAGPRALPRDIARRDVAVDLALALQAPRDDRHLAEREPARLQAPHRVLRLRHVGIDRDDTLLRHDS